MKTLKLIIAGVAATILINSCSSDRDEEVREDAIESVKKSNQEKFKLNKSGTESRDAEPQAVSDTIIVKSGNATMADDPDTNLDPGNEGDPKDVPPRK
ncbi:hypothetical protein [Chryseobacterium sp. JV274]|uniref:hypothetical protein n=1 Tax=Chryseobacterium sp. JV274 TaxID=1932669 RepID=UPI0015C2A80C|nr:hypothetical protein [Chryseobacterium sp. JV274]CAD0220430.1 conserved protein of unknown function [Chryseobacterium sp. JV274]